MTVRVMPHLERRETTGWAMALGCILALVGCAPKPIPGTTIDDTADNRAILQTLERYRATVENRDASGLLALVSHSFRDTGGTSNPEDDLTYATLQQNLPERLARIQDVHADLDIRAIAVDKDSANAIFYYNLRFRIPSLTTRPQNESDLKQMKLHKEAGQWKIISGI